jgi:hypothetical protein
MTFMALNEMIQETNFPLRALVNRASGSRDVVTACEVRKAICLELTEVARLGADRHKSGPVEALAVRAGASRQLGSWRDRPIIAL